MRKLILLFIVLLLIMAVAASTFAGSRSGSRGRRNWDNTRCFEMRNQHREQKLGGKSGRAWKGLENAAGNSSVIIEIEIVPEDTNTEPPKEPVEVLGNGNNGGAKEPKEKAK